MRKRVCVCQRECVCLRERVCVCQRDRERVCVSERDTVCVCQRECVGVCVSETVWGYFIKKKGILVWCKKHKEWVGWAHVNSKSNTYSLDTDPDGCCSHWTEWGKRRARHSTSSVCVRERERERVCVCVRESVWM